MISSAWRATGVCVNRSLEQRRDTITLIVALVGESGKRLFDYYSRVAKETNFWIGIEEFPNHFVERQQVDGGGVAQALGRVVTHLLV